MLRNKKAGFTLIEILIVVVIMAVLAATVIPQFTESTADAKASSVLFNLHTLRSQIQLYRTHHDGLRPSADLNELLKKTNAAGTQTGDTPFGPYLTKIPENSFTNSATVKSVTAAPTDTDVTDTDGWLYNATTGEIWINHKDYEDQ